MEIPVSQTTRLVFKGEIRKQQNHVTHSKGNPRVTPVETQWVAKTRSGCRVELFISLFLPFRKERTA